MSQHQNQPTRSSGWEKADKVASGIGTVASGIGWIMIKAYALAIIAGGIAICVAIPGGGSKAIGVGIAAYGVYLLLGGSWIIY